MTTNIPQANQTATSNSASQYLNSMMANQFANTQQFNAAGNQSAVLNSAAAAQALQ